jgi:hypothetical protein
MHCDLDVVPVAELEDVEPIRGAGQTRARRGGPSRATRPLAWSALVLVAVAALCARPLGTYAGTAMPRAAVPVHAPPPDLHDLVPGDFIGTSFVDHAHGYGIEQLSAAIGFDSAYARFVSTSDGGAIWAPVGRPLLNARGIAFVNATSGVVATGAHASLRTSDGGKTWSPTPVALDTVQVGGGGIWGVTACDGNSVEPCRVSVERSIDGGISWHARSLPCSPTMQPSVAAPDATTLWLSCVGGPALATSPTFDCVDCGNPITIGGTLSLYRSTDGGRSWREIPSVPQRRVFDAQLIASSPNAAAIEVDAAYFSTRDGGRSWQPVTTASGR